MTSDRFTYDGRAGITVGGVALDQAGPGADPVRALLTALTGGRSFRASTDPAAPITVLAPFDVTPEFQCQSSGSSGRAKTIRRTQASWIRSFEQTAQRFGIGPDDTVAVPGTLAHSLALYGLVEALHLGARAELLFPLRPDRQWRRMHEAGVTVLYATPTQLRLMLAGEAPALPALRHVFCGGGKLDAQCRADLAHHAPHAQILEFYGATETSFITMADRDTPPGSVGRPYPGVEMQIRDADTGGVGEIWLRSPYLFAGYATGSAADTRWDDRFLSIGEMGYLDAQGNLYLKGRKNRMVTVADHNVFPEDIEAVLTATSGRLSAAIPVPDAQRGHAIVAVLAGAEDDALPARLRQACSRALGPHAAPRRVLFADPFPLLPAGKPDLVALRQLALGDA